MTYKKTFWDKVMSETGTSESVRHVICQKCGRSVGSDVIGYNMEKNAREMRHIARQHHEATGHSEFFFADGYRRYSNEDKQRKGKVS